jgi:metal-sulfur cluster biosynthetic enzyme
MAVNAVEVMEALREIYDPEIPVNIVDLGLVYDVEVKPAMQMASELAPEPETPLEDVAVKMTLTSPGCPSHVSIGQAVKSTIEKLPGVQTATVEFIWEPQWGPERISAEGREKLGIEI